MAKFWEWHRGQDTYKRIGPKAIRGWLASMRRAGRKPAGINAHYAGVRAFFVWAVAERGLAYNPTLTTRGARRKGRRHKHDALSLQIRAKQSKLLIVVVDGAGGESACAAVDQEGIDLPVEVGFFANP